MQLSLRSSSCGHVRVRQSLSKCLDVVYGRPRCLSFQDVLYDCDNSKVQFLMQALWQFVCFIFVV